MSRAAFFESEYERLRAQLVEYMLTLRDVRRRVQELECQRDSVTLESIEREELVRRVLEKCARIAEASTPNYHGIWTFNLSPREIANAIRELNAEKLLKELV